MYERFADRARKVVQLAKQSPPPTSPQPPGVVTRKPNYDAESMFWPRNCRKTSLVARRFPRGRGNSSWRPLGSVTAERSEESSRHRHFRPDSSLRSE